MEQKLIKMTADQVRSLFDKRRTILLLKEYLRQTRGVIADPAIIEVEFVIQVTAK